MKQIFKYIITTITIIGVIAFSLLTISAAELKEYDITSVNSFSRRYGGVNTPISTLPLVSDTPYTSGIFISSANFAEQYNYTKYINFQYTETVSGVSQANAPYFSIFVSPSEFNSIPDKSGINYIEFNFGCIMYSGTNTDSSLPFSPVLLRVNSEYPSQVSYSYNFSSPISGSVSSGENTTNWSYRSVNCKIILDDSFRFQNDDVISLTLRSTSIRINAPNGTDTPAPVNYSLGISPITVGFMSTDEYIASISSSVSNIENTIVGISEGLSKTFTPEQEAIINKFNTTIDVYRQEEIQIETDISGIIDQYNSNSINLDISGAGVVLDNNLGIVFADGGFLGFWEILWNNPYVIAAMLLVVVFAISGWIIYGVR